MGKAAALRQAQLDIREDYPHPYYWAAFVLSGDAGEPASAPSTQDNHSGGLCASAVLPLALLALAWLCASAVLPLALLALAWLWRTSTR